MTQVDLGLTNVSRFDSVDSAISVNDANKKPGASQWSHSGGVQEVALACSGLLLSAWLIIAEDDTVSSGLCGSSPNLWRCNILLCCWCALLVWWCLLRRVM
jgi:hypothetical protein